MNTAMPFPRLAAPPMARIRQKLKSDRIADVRGETARMLLGRGLGRSVRQGSRIAITAGSRGIGDFTELLGGIADAVKSCGGEPFLIPAMGSHGGAVAEGQVEILRRLGVDEQSVGAPIRATMDTVELGAADNGAVAHLDRIAAEADGIIVLGRVKTHPESAEDLASGLLKMCTIGLGKQKGAQQAHNHGLWDSVRAVPKLQLAKANILYGVAVVESAYRHPCRIEVVEPDYDAFLIADRHLLRLAKDHLAKIPFDELDLLIVDELGKTVSGAGMDPNIIGHWRIKNAPKKPDFKRIVVLSLTWPSLGNGLGIGMADFTTQRFLDYYDPAVSYVNLLTATEPGSTTKEGPMPLALPTDREAIEVGLYSSLPGKNPHVCRIVSTAALDEIQVSEGLMGKVRTNPDLELVDRPRLLPFDDSGNLPAHGATE